MNNFLDMFWNSLPFGKLWFFNENYLLAIKLRIFRIKRSCKELHVIITISLLSYVVKKYYIKQSTGAIEFMYVAFIITYVPSAIMLRRNPLSRVCYVYIYKLRGQQLLLWLSDQENKWLVVHNVVFSILVINGNIWIVI